MARPLPRLPDATTLQADYRRLHSLRGVAALYGVTVEAVRSALRSALTSDEYEALLDEIRAIDDEARFQLSRDEFQSDLLRWGTPTAAAKKRGVTRYAYNRALDEICIDESTRIELTREARKLATIDEYAKACRRHGRMLNTTDMRNLGLRALWGRIERTFQTFDAFMREVSPDGQGGWAPRTS